MSKPEFTTRHLADAAGTSTQHWRNQVDDQKITASVNVKRGPRRLLRFTIDDIEAYDPQLAQRVRAARGTSDRST
jgi:hypothetical protein